MFKDIESGSRNITSSDRSNYSEDIRVKEDVSFQKSPRYVRKKHASAALARRSHLLKDKITSYKMKTSFDKKEMQSEPKIKTADEYFNSFSPEVLERLFLNSTAEKDFSVKNNFTFKRSSSFPDIHQKLNSSFISHSGSLSDISNLELESLPVISNKQVSVSHLPKEELFDNLYHNINSVENLAIGNESRHSSTSTVRDRISSIDSSYSIISATDKDIEDVFKKESNVPNDNPAWKPQHFRSISDFNVESPLEYSENSKVFSLPSSFSDNKEPPRKSIFEGKQMIVPTECFFPRPQQGQSLTSFLSSNQFKISAELDRENAHFCISEALISAIEHMKCSFTQQNIEREDESDEEIQKLTQRIRIRRRERQREKTMKSFMLLSDGKTDTTSQSASPPLSSHSSDFDADSIKSEDEVEDLELSAYTDSNLSSIKESGLSLSMASLYSDADIRKALCQRNGGKQFQETDSLNLSAESVALSLLKRFSEKHLPKASDLQWLVSEQDAPQRLLPLPDSWPVSPDSIEEEYYLTNIRLRGNLEWAPPRAQIISIVHPHLRRKEVIEKQKFRCAGCGMKIEKSYIKKFRYCSYFGKYFCQCCHSNGLAYIPGCIIWKWDFTKYYVSKFAWDHLDNMFYDPLFNIEAINSNVYKKVKSLQLCCNYRQQLFYLKDFMKTCRKAELIEVTLAAQNEHIICDPHVYSLNDLLQVKSGEFLKQVKMLTNYCLEHVKQCILCQAKGFICEICGNEQDIIYPFQLHKVVLCQVCSSCFHKCCFKNVKCPRCIRIAERKKRLNQK